MRKRIPKILVTGGAGFIGSAFVRLFVKRGHEVLVIDKLTYAGDLARLKESERGYKFYRVDICNKPQDSGLQRGSPWADMDRCCMGILTTHLFFSNMLSNGTERAYDT